MADGNRIPASALRRWVQEVLRLLAARAPRLERALKKIAKKGRAVVLLDGTVMSATWPTASRHCPTTSSPPSPSDSAARSGQAPVDRSPGDSPSAVGKPVP